MHYLRGAVKFFRNLPILSLRAKKNFAPQRIAVYNSVLIVSMLVVVLSPFLLDFLLSVQEMKYAGHEKKADKKKSPKYV